MLVTPGYWQSTYWPSSYWAVDYWLEYGTGTGTSYLGVLKIWDGSMWRLLH